MKNNLNKGYDFDSAKKEIFKFIDNNKNTLEILNAIQPDLVQSFPNTTFSLEISDELPWTTEQKLLVNVHVSEETFFNGMLTHFNDIYEKIDPLIQDILCPIVLFPSLSNEKYDKMGYNSAINLIARTAYFNSDFDKNYQREMTLREIPKSQQVSEIIAYCETHENPDISDIVFDLQLDLFDVDRILDDLENQGISLNVKY